MRTFGKVESMHSAASLSHLEAFIFDLDGVIWKGNAPIEGAVESIARLRAAGKRVFYCTNNSRRAPADFAETLRSIGIECEDDEIMTSSTATSLYLQSLFTGPYTAYVVGEDGLVQTIRRTGAIVMTSPIVPQRSDLHDNHGSVDCVIVGLDATFTYHKLRVAQRLIMNGARFIATNRDATFPTPYGLVPGAGSVVAAVETATGVTPVTLGKPQPFMAQLLMQKFGLSPEITCMVGDRLDTDIVSAKRAHIAALLVTTGVHSREVGERAKNLQKPDAIFDDMPALCEAILSGGQTVATDLDPFGAEAEAAVTGVTVAGAAAGAVAGAAVIAADAAQHEPEAALHTPFAKETVESGGETPLDFQTLDLDSSQTAESTTEPGAEDVPSPIAASGAEAVLDAAVFSFDDEKPAAEPAPTAEATEAPAVEGADEAPAEPEPFNFDMSFADDATSTPAQPNDPPAADTGPTADAVRDPEPDGAPGEAVEEAAPEEATEEQVPAAAKGDDKWWESLDSI